jgi:hypothetical protein
LQFMVDSSLDELGVLLFRVDVLSLTPGNRRLFF